MGAKAAPIDVADDGADCERDESLDEHDVPKIIIIFASSMIPMTFFSPSRKLGKSCYQKNPQIKCEKFICNFCLNMRYTYLLFT